MPVGTINTAKELARAYQPLLLAEFVFTDGTVLLCSTHGLRTSDGGFQYAGNDYLPRILNQDIAATQILSEQGIALPPSVTLQLNDGDRYLWENFEKARGFKGARLTLRFVFWNVDQNDFSSDYLTPFVGICSAPSLDETALTVRAVSLLNMEQTLLPTIRIQKTCPWIFPATAAERQEAADNADSFFYECGYSPDASGPNARGNFESGSTCFTKCNHSKADCEARGMYSKDSQDRTTGTFGGEQWDPPQSFRSRGYISGKWEEGYNTSNEAKYGDFVPFVYGTSWVDPVILNIVGDANSTRLEALICFGEIEEVLKVLVNDVEVPQSHGWDGTEYQVSDVLFRWSPVNRGDRYGSACQDALYDGKGDPHGNFAVIEVVVPRRLADSSSVPRVRVLVRGPKLRKYKRITSISVSGGVATVTFDGANDDVASNDQGFEFEIIDSSVPALNKTWYGLTNWTYGPPGTIQFTATGVPDGSASGGVFRYKSYSDNPAWVLADVLVWSNWTYSDLDLQSFIDAAMVCDQPVSYQNQFGQAGTHPRYRCSTVLRQRRAAAEIVRGICAANNLLLVPNVNGRLQVIVKQTLASQQPSAVPGSNYSTPVPSKPITWKTGDPIGQGYAAYKFDPSNILRASGVSRLSVTQRSNADAPNRASFTFQDADNNYAFDAINVVDSEALTRAGQEVSGGLSIEGITNYDQARRVVATWMAEAFRGNPRNHPVGDAGGTLQFEIETTFKVIHLKVGHICLLAWPPLGIEDQMVRVVKIQPATNFETTRVTLQWHSDEWYLDTWGQEDTPIYSAQRRNRLARPPYPPMIGRHREFVNPDPFWEDERPDYVLLSSLNFGEQISDQYIFRVAGLLPVTAFSDQIRPPFAPVQGTTSSTGGQLPGGRTYWVALVAVDADGKRTPHGTVSRVFVPSGTNTNTVMVSGIDWDAATVGYDLFVGTDPVRLYCYGYNAGRPSSVGFDGPLVGTARRPVPDTELDSLRFKVKRLTLAGAWEGLVTGVTETTITCAGAGWTANAWSGRICSITGRFLGVGLVDSPPSASFLVVSNTDDTLTLDPAFGAPPLGLGNPADDDLLWLVIRTKATDFSPTTLGDSALSLGADEHVGRVVRIVAGAGRGQWRRIHSHTASVLTIDGAWETEPDATSVFWIEGASWDRTQDVLIGDVTEAEQTVRSEFVVDVRGLEHQSLMILPVGVDGAGNESMETASSVAISDFYLFKDTASPPNNYQSALTITVQGTLAIGSDLGPRASFAVSQRAKAVKVEVKQAPTGAAITVQFYVGGASWLAVTIPAGSTSGNASAGDIEAAAEIPAGANIRIDLASVGTTFPGSDLSAFIYL